MSQTIDLAESFAERLYLRFHDGAVEIAIRQVRNAPDPEIRSVWMQIVTLLRDKLDDEPA